MTFQHEWKREEARVIKIAWGTEEGRAALNIVIDTLCGIHRASMDDSPLRTAFQEGRRSIAIALATAIKTDLEKIEQEPDDRLARPATFNERAADAAAIAAGLAAGKSADAVRASLKRKRRK